MSGKETAMSTLSETNDKLPDRCAQPSKLVDVAQMAHTPPANAALSMLQRPLEKLLQLDIINELYATHYKKVGDYQEQRQIFQLCLDILKVRAETSPADVKKIPANGSLVVVCNHPFGGLEGVVLGALLLQVRPDLKIMGNYLLKRIAGIRDSIIAVDPFQGPNAARVNMRGLKEALNHVKSGGLLQVFPAGEVASFNLVERRVVDPPWSPHVAGIIRRTRASVLPVYFPGNNSLLFQLLGLVHPLLRTAMLPRELVNKRDSRVSLCIGKAIPWRKLQRFETDQALIEFLRFNTFFLKNRQDTKNRRLKVVVPLVKNEFRAKMPIVPATASVLLERDVHSLPVRQRLVENGDLAVYIAESPQIPNLLNEIGRLREITFREVQEGTGKSIDLDEFDAYYRHLFLWNHRQRELVGAYRLGLTDQILRRYGPSGLYTNQLFRYKPELLPRLQHSIEFGRSFIRAEYQRKFNSLTMIWRGIGELVSQNPQYNLLFGPVSISKDYQRLSRNLMIRFLKTNRFDFLLSRLVSPRKPYRSRRIRGISQHILQTSFSDIDDISLLISEIEKDGKGIPILLRHYLKLNGQLISFNVDNAFSGVVDGLLMVDLTQTEEKLLRRFMGNKGYAIFKRYHSQRPKIGPDAGQMPAGPHRHSDHEAA
jgi:putative hemolysin